MSGRAGRARFVSINLSSPNRESSVLRATTELFVQGDRHRDEARRYEELATYFLPKIHHEDRLYVADLLADCEEAPAAILRMLAKDAIEVAKPVLERSIALSNLDLLMIIAATAASHHQVIAERPGLPADVAQALRLTGDPTTIEILDRRLPEIDAARMRDAASLAAAPVLPAAPAAPAGRGDPFHPDDFLAMAPAQRLGWLGELSNRRVMAPQRSTARQTSSVLRTAYHGSRIVGLARRRERDALIHAIGDSLGIDGPRVGRMVDDPSGEPLVLVLKAMRLPDADAFQVLLLANPAYGLSVDAFRRLADLYAAMEPNVAEALLAGWRGEGSGAKAGHQPFHSEAEGVRGAGRAAERPAAEQIAPEREKRA